MTKYNITLDLLHHNRNNAATPYIICGSVTPPSSKNEEQLVCASLCWLTYETNFVGSYTCQLPYQPSTTNHLTLRKPATVPLKYNAFYIAIRGTYDFNNLITGIKLIKNTNVNIDLKQVDKTIKHIEKTIKPYQNAGAKYFLTGHSAGGVYTLKLLNRWHTRYPVTIYNYNPAIVKPHIKQLQKALGDTNPYNCKVYVYRTELDIVSHQYRLCETICDKQWMRVVVLEDDHNEDNTEHDTHSSTSWVNEILNAHTMLQFIHMRAIISSNVVLWAIKKEYKDHNKNFRRILQRVLLVANMGGMLVLHMLRANLLHKGRRLCNKLKLVTKRKTVRRNHRSLNKKNTTIKTTRYNMQQLFHDYNKQMRE
jgi:hypothetical protein